MAAASDGARAAGCGGGGGHGLGDRGELDPGLGGIGGDVAAHRGGAGVKRLDDVADGLAQELDCQVVDAGASMTVPVVGALLVFALMIGPAAAARSFTRRPGHAIAVATGIALVTVWAGIALSYRTNWPLGFYLGVIAAGFFLLGQAWTAVRRHGVRGRTPAAPVPEHAC